MQTREGEPDREPLTQDEVNVLEEGTRVLVKWSGGNGPAEYIVRVWKDIRFAGMKNWPDEPLNAFEHRELDFIGKERFHTRVWLVYPSTCHPVSNS